MEELEQIKLKIAGLTHNDQVCILWDIENVNPGYKSLFVDGLIEYASKFGRLSIAKAFGDWSNRAINKMAPELSEKSFEMVHTHTPVKRKDAADFEVVAQGMEVALKFPAIKSFIIVSGDIDFRPLVTSLKRNGKEVYIIYDQKRVNDMLLSLADDYVDYRQIIPGGDDEPIEKTEKSLPKKKPQSKKLKTSKEKEKQLLDALSLLVECLNVFDKSLEPNLSLIKVRMKRLSPSFDETVLGFKQWSEFIQYAESKKVITVKGKGNTMRVKLSSPALKIETESSIPTKKVMKVLKDLDKGTEPRFHVFSKVSSGLQKLDFDYSKFGYNKFKKYILDLESRGLVETQVDGLKHFVQRVV